MPIGKPRGPEPLKAPYPYIGGKGKVASLVWRRFGAVENYIEPFYGSGVVHLRRPLPYKGKETVNDKDCFIPNFWRAVKADPDKLAYHANWPVSEADLYARHNWLVTSDECRNLRQRIRSDPEFCDFKVAGWWVWGQSLWIGGGWCTLLEPGQEVPSQRPHTWEQIPDLSGGFGAGGCGVHTTGGGRPQLTDAFDIGRGVNANGDLWTDRERHEWLKGWFQRLADRIRLTRYLTGDWDRVCSSESVLTRLGLTGVFLDPPYRTHLQGGKGKGKKSRATGLYAVEEDVVDAVIAWCLKWGQDPFIRAGVCGLTGEGYEVLQNHGWRVEAWEASGGYGNQSGKKAENAKRERIWFSPHCLFERTLLDLLP